MKTDRKQPQVYPEVGVYQVQEISGYDMVTIRGQEHVKRALEVAAAGGHHILLSGPPGSGKTLLAHTLLSILPPLTQEEALELTTLYRTSDRFPMERFVLLERPFRKPLPTITSSGLLGDERGLCPGEVSLAHRGVLFLDDLPAFNQRLVEGLYQPLEKGACVSPATWAQLPSRRKCCSWQQFRRRYHWVLPTFRYQDTADLLASLHVQIIGPAEQKAQELIQSKSSPI